MKVWVRMRDGSIKERDDLTLLDHFVGMRIVKFELTKEDHLKVKKMYGREVADDCVLRLLCAFPPA